MRKSFIVLLLGALVLGALMGFAGIATACTPTPGPSANSDGGGCIPNAAQCATGDFNGTYTVGAPGRGAICVGGMGHIVVYTGGNANALCGTIIVADQVVTGSYDSDPNGCPQ